MALGYDGSQCYLPGFSFCLHLCMIGFHAEWALTDCGRYVAGEGHLLIPSLLLMDQIHELM